MSNRSCQAWQHDRRDGRCLKPALKDSDFCVEHFGALAGPSRCGSDQHAHPIRQACSRIPCSGEAISGSNYCWEHSQELAIAEAPYAMYDAIKDEEYLEPVDWDDNEWADGVESSVDDRVGKQLGELDWQVERTLAKGKVTRNDIIAWHRQICEEARDLATAKNRDYAADSDPLRNFRLSSQAAGITMSQSCLVYLAENVAKYRSFIENGGKNAVRTDKLIDHIKDSINFNILLYAILIDEGYFAHDTKS